MFYATLSKNVKQKLQTTKTIILEEYNLFGILVIQYVVVPLFLKI